MKIKLLSLAFLLTGMLSAQNIGINSTGTAPNASALLDVDAAPANNKGVLVPRLALVATNNASPVTSPATSLLIYNTATASSGSTAVVPGYYYWDGTKWVRFQYAASGSSSLDWSLTGNASTVDGTNFLGTTDNVPLNFRVNNLKAGRIDPTLANTFYGILSGNANTTGNSNTAIGAYALQTNAVGIQNTAIGTNALQANTTGSANVSVGFGTLPANTTGYQNTGIGTSVLRLNTTGYLNTASGLNASEFNVSGRENAAHGASTLWQNRTGNENTAIGNQAIATHSTGSGNTATGFQTLSSLTSGDYNLALGYKSGVAMATGNNNILIGRNADVLRNGLTNASAIGYFAQVDTSNAIVLGGNGANPINVGIGVTRPRYKLHIQSSRNNDGIYVFAPNGNGGEITFQDNTHFNVSNGRTINPVISMPNYGMAVPSNTTGYGMSAETWLSGNGGIAFFTHAFQRMLIDVDGKVGINTNNPLTDLHVVGTIETSYRTAATTSAQAHYAQLSADGALRLHRNLSAPSFTSSNGYIDYVNDAGTGYDFRLSFERNIGPTGSMAFSDNINTFMTIAQGSGNISMSGPNAVGYKLDVLGSMAASSAYIRSNAGINTLPSATYVLDVNGTVRGVGAFNTTSDRRKKRNIKSLSLNGLEIVKKLNPVSYDWITVLDDGMKGTQLGFIAQELEEIIPSIVVTANDEQQSKSVKYNELLPIYAKAIQEQQAQIEQLKLKANKVDELQTQIELLKQQNEAILKLIEKNK